MSAAKSSTRKRPSNTEVSKSKLKKIPNEDDPFGADISSDIKGILSALHQIKEKAQMDDQKKKEETVSSVAADVRSMIDELKSKFEKDRQSLTKALSKSTKECENSLKSEAAKFQALHENFCKEKATHLQTLKDTISKFEEEKEKLFMRYEQLRKKEKTMLLEHEKACEEKISQLDSSLKKKKQDNATFSILRKTLGSFLGNGSDEDFPPDD